MSVSAESTPTQESLEAYSTEGQGGSGSDDMSHSSSGKGEDGKKSAVNRTWNAQDNGLQLDSDKYSEATYEKIGAQLGSASGRYISSAFTTSGTVRSGDAMATESHPIDFPSLCSVNSNRGTRQEVTHAKSFSVSSPPSFHVCCWVILHSSSLSFFFSPTLLSHSSLVFQGTHLFLELSILLLQRFILEQSGGDCVTSSLPAANFLSFTHSTLKCMLTKLILSPQISSAYECTCLWYYSDYYSFMILVAFLFHFSSSAYMFVCYCFFLQMTMKLDPLLKALLRVLVFCK